MPGIDVTDDPLLQGRLFSYLDTQLTRLGGPNFNQLPINRPHAPVNDMLRDGYHQTADHAGVAPYRPNSLDGGCPFHAGAGDRPFVDVPQRVAEGVKEREAPASYDDHFSQVRMFWVSLSPVEQLHTAAAYTFELGKVYEQAIKERQLQALANVDEGLCAAVAAGLGLPAPAPTVPLADVAPSPALSQVGRTWPVTGRVVGIVADEDSDLSEVAAARERVLAGGMVPLVIGPHGGVIEGAGGPVTVQRTFVTVSSVEVDALLLAGAPTPAPGAEPDLDAKAGGPSTPDVDPRVSLLVNEAFRHGKAVGGWGTAATVLAAAGVDEGAPGVVLGDGHADVLTAVEDLLAAHRSWERFAPVAG